MSILVMRGILTLTTAKIIFTLYLVTQNLFTEVLLSQLELISLLQLVT
jgi:hypothetical protein